MDSNRTVLQEGLTRITNVTDWMAKPGVAKFHDVQEVPYGCFSILSPHPIVVRHLHYPSVHHYFLCYRFNGSPLEEDISGDLSVGGGPAREARRGPRLQRRTGTVLKLILCCWAIITNLAECRCTSDSHSNWHQDHCRPHSNGQLWGTAGMGQGRTLGIILMAVRAAASG